MIIQFCTGASLDNQKRYEDELWSDYIERIKEWCIIRKIPEEKIFEKLRFSKAPLGHQILFNSNGISIEELIARIKGI